MPVFSVRPVPLTMEKGFWDNMSFWAETVFSMMSAINIITRIIQNVKTQNKPKVAVKNISLGKNCQLGQIKFHFILNEPSGSSVQICPSFTFIWRCMYVRKTHAWTSVYSHFWPQSIARDGNGVGGDIFWSCEAGRGTLNLKLLLLSLTSTRHGLFCSVCV